jgi:glycosyltransferase involved in cell wall biosynthesis
MVTPAISVIMPCHNRAHDLLRVLQEYNEQEVEEPFEMIAVDDASSDTTYEVLNSFQPLNYSLRVVKLDKNSGPAAARNQGIQLAQAPLILFVGDDILPERNLIRGHLTAHRLYRETNIAILGRITWPQDLPVNTLMTHIDGIGAQQFSYYYLQDGQEYDFRHFYTANISIKKAFLCSLEQWFDTNFPYAAFEDVELAYRLSKHGLHIRYLSLLNGYHYHYHTIWSFSERQRKAGLASCTLTSKHPTLYFYPAFSKQYLRVIRLLKYIRRPLLPSATITWIEEATCRLASFYEWYPNPLLDQLYRGVLDYFYYDGVIQGIFKNIELQKRLRSIHVVEALISVVKEFINQAKSQGIHLPEGYNTLKLLNLSDSK